MPLSTNNRIANLSKEKQAQLLKHLSEKNKSANRRIRRRSKHSPCQLSFAQERLWFLARLEPNAPFYNMAGIIKIHGQLNAGILEQALNEVVCRHEVLRTSFSLMDDKLKQIVHPFGKIDVRQVDLSDLAFEQRKQTLDTLQNQEAQQVFDLANLPLIRALLVKLDTDNYQLSITLHHIIADEWSLRLLIKEVSLFYQRMQKGLPLIESELLIQYADFAEWQCHYLQGELYDKQLAYWRKHLALAPESLNLPTDYARPLQISYRGDDSSFQLPDDIAFALIALEKQTNTTMFAIMMTAFNVLLWRYSGQNNICVGYPIANRNHKDIEELIGFFVNLHVLHTDLSSNPNFLVLLEQVKSHLLEAQNYQDLPFEKLVEALQPQRELSRSPLFQVMLVYQHTELEKLVIPNLQFDFIDAKVQSAKYDLTFNIFRTGNQIRCSINYSTDLFTEETIKRMATHWQQLLASISKQPQIPISELTMLSHSEKHQVLHDWNATGTAYSQNFYIHQLFEEQVKRSPDAIALKFLEQALRYSELNAKANQLAHYLISQGISSDDLVGICLERSLEMVIGLLGILKAGAAYVPLDPHLPKERLAFMLNDIKPAMVLTQAKFADYDFDSSKMLVLDDWLQFESFPAVNPDVILHPDSLAYCIYTSGSTGQPKGAGVSHQGILNRLQWMQTEYQLNNQDSVLQKTPYSFDVSVWEFFWTLATGARLVIAAPELHKDTHALITLIQHENITIIHFVPSMLQMFINMSGVENCGSLKRVICSGEALSVDMVRQFQQKLSAALYNLYGPTEASVDVSHWTCPSASQDITIPIGKPIANIQLYILDNHLNPVPFGTAGELHIAGVGLGRGYLNRPALTAEKFIPNPYGVAGSRLYKTGDLVRYRSDGNIEYLGRIDHQVKIRGFRIELGEIEATLLTHADVKEAVVLAREDQAGEKRLVAYLVEQQAGTLQIDNLKIQLKASLFDYMIPSAFVVLEKMPLSNNGKLDRKKLPMPDVGAMPNREYEAPQNEIEIAISEIWQVLFNTETVSRHDHFFELGGHSLMVISLIQCLHERGLFADVRTIFSNPILSDMAIAIAGNQIQIPSIEIPPNLLDAGFSPNMEEFRI